MSAAARMPLTPGSYVALATPMLDNGHLDIPTLRSVLQWHKVTNGASERARLPVAAIAAATGMGQFAHRPNP